MEVVNISARLFLACRRRAEVLGEFRFCLQPGRRPTAVALCVAAVVAVMVVTVMTPVVASVLA
jgi:hypothetical protein